MVGVGFMLIVEIYRLSYLPGYSTLNKFINSFRDGKDIGEFVWAHVYLLLGCSLTIWLGELGGLSGVIALGLCDSTASIVGKSVGRTKWFDSKKSVEGSIVFMICCTLGMIYTCETEFGNNVSL
jgi:dolichol kinase